MRFPGVTLLFVISTTIHAQAPVNSLSWLAGCWRAQAGRSVIDEMWMAPSGGVMLGASRTSLGDTTRSYEFTRILARGDTLVFAAMPSGQTYTEFSSIVRARDSIVFENPSHDFPQRIIYRRQDSARVHARVEGVIDGRLRSQSFDYRRVSCDERQ